SLFMLFLVNRIGTLAKDWKVGLLAAAYWTLGPLYLSIIGLLATGGHVEACAFGGFILAGIFLLTFKPIRNPGLLAGLIGITAGLAWWSSLLSAPFLLAGALVLVIGCPRLLLTRVPLSGLAGFLLGSFPFWLWEALHDFSTFSFFEGHGVGLFKQLWSGLYMVLRFSFFQSFLGDWWDGHSVLTQVPSLLAWTVFVLIYLPAFLISLYTIGQWLHRLLTLRNPFQGITDLIVLSLWILILSFATSEQGANGSLRYSLTLYLPITVLVALWVNKFFQFSRTLGAGTLIFLLGFNLFLHHLFLNEFKDLPYRPIDRLIQALKDQSIRYAYADNRISQVLTFESGESIICADYYGQRNFNYLRMVDAAPPRQVAIVTHQKLGNPYPVTMAAALKLLGGSARKAAAGDYVFWYDFKEPTEKLLSLSPTEWRMTASQEQEQVGQARDRDILTSWESPARAGDCFLVDINIPRRLARISILPSPIGGGLPSGLRVELSLDGKQWGQVAELQANDMLSGLYWYHGRPRLDDLPHFQISFSPQMARFIRLTNLTTPENPKETWRIAELFIYEAVEHSLLLPGKALKAYHRAEEALDHWWDDPTGPHPLFPGTNLKTRQKQVNWQSVIKNLQEAIQEAPDWEEAHQLLGTAVDWGGLWNRGEKNAVKGLNWEALFPAKTLSKIPLTQMKASSNVNDDQSRLAVDGDPSTRWSSARGQERGMFFQADLGTDHLVDGFALFLGSSLNDYPRNLKIMGSRDGNSWEEIRTVSKAYYAFAGNQIYKKTYYSFSPVLLRYLKLVQGGRDPNFWWSIYEMEVFKKG
ncbi:MAG TPA: discoidin domain-containing protein, partial [Thermodesulfobacteriota bacterium]|nr:discoidin domain-containing protein [Thermodesulfobacteriota bacterium]